MSNYIHSSVYLKYFRCLHTLLLLCTFFIRNTNAMIQLLSGSTYKKTCPTYYLHLNIFLAYGEISVRLEEV